MPGHMNVLLAEAEIDYDALVEMDQINPTFPQVDVAIVLGANDVDQARVVVVIKRSLSPGFAGIPNPLFAADNALMMFGDGKKAIQELVTCVKEAA